jgi:hypothetical protein
MEDQLYTICDSDPETYKYEDFLKIAITKEDINWAWYLLVLCESMTQRKRFI